MNTPTTFHAHGKDWFQHTPETEAFYAKLYDSSVPDVMIKHASGEEREKMRELERQRDAAREDARRLAAGLVHMAAKSHHMAKPFDHLCICADCEDARAALAAHEALAATLQA